MEEVEINKEEREEEKDETIIPIQQYHGTSSMNDFIIRSKRDQPQTNTNFLSVKPQEKSNNESLHSVTVQEMIEKDLLDKIPPDFTLARIHGDAQRVKNIDTCEYEHSKLNNIELFCPCCQMPTTKSAPLYPL